MCLQPTDGDENAFCGARIRACRVETHLDACPPAQHEINALPYFQRAAKRARHLAGYPME
jgi:hypothetical protein